MRVIADDFDNDRDIMTGFAEEGGPFPYLVDSVRRTLFRSEPIGWVEPNREGWTVELVDWGAPRQPGRRTLQPGAPWRYAGSGVAEGRLLGGTLEVLEFLRGTAWWPAPEQWDGALLFLETSEEAPAPHVLARALRTYAEMGVLQRLSGILLGRPGGNVAPADFAGYEAAALRVVRNEQALEIPIVSGMDFGHTDPFFVLPYGMRARVDCESERFEILESAVSDDPLQIGRAHV